MPNPQLVKGGAAVAVPITPGGSLTGSQTAPPTGGFSIWEGNTQVVPNTSLMSLPVSVNGITLSALVGASGGYTSATLQAASGSSVPGATGATVMVNGGGYLSVGPVDVSGGASAPTTAPTLTAASGAGQNTLTNSDANASGYAWDVFRGTAPGGEGATPVGTVNSGTTYADTTAPVGTPVYYTAKYRNSAGDGPASPEVSATAGTATAADFSLSAVLMGGGREVYCRAYWEITVAPLNGFAGTVLFTMEPISGIVTHFGPGNPPPSGYQGRVVGLTLALGSPGTYAPVVTATSGSLTHTLTLPPLTAVAPPDYTTGVAVI